MRPVRVVHVVRAALGGAFRHVLDLARGQAQLGLEVGILCDSLTGGASAAAALDGLAPHCRLGVTRISMHRAPGAGDLAALRGVLVACRSLGAEILHGHGAKGGAFARLAARRVHAKAFYTPHGGSLHYRWTSAGMAFLALERMLVPRTDGLVFVCEFERRSFLAKIGGAALPHRVIHNGLAPEEFSAIAPSPEAADLVFVGELRFLKGVDVLLEAIARLAPARMITATIVGRGPDEAAFQAIASRLGVAARVRFAGAMPAREAFRMGRILVMPSRAESFPYVVLEAAAAAVPVIASAVGGIPEILGDGHASMTAPGDAAALAAAIDQAVADLPQRRAGARRLARHLAERFTAARMVAATSQFYAECLAAAVRPAPGPASQFDPAR